MDWTPSLPESFSFYELGQVELQRSRPPEPAGVSAIAFEVIASDNDAAGRSWIVFAGGGASSERAPETGSGFELELANVLASRIAGRWISPPRALDSAALARLLSSVSVTQGFQYALKTPSGSEMPLQGWILASLTGGSGHA